MAYCYLLRPTTVYNFQWNRKYLSGNILRYYVTECWQLRDISSASTFRSHVRVFLLTWIIVNTMTRIFHSLCTESFGKSSKNCYFSRLHNDTKTYVYKYRQGKLAFYFTNNVAEKWSYEVQGTLESSIYIFMHLTHFKQAA